jgi:hypothetical protein
MIEFICYDCDWRHVCKSWECANDASETHLEGTHHDTIEVR